MFRLRHKLTQTERFPTWWYHDLRRSVAPVTQPISSVTWPLSWIQTLHVPTTTSVVCVSKAWHMLVLQNSMIGSRTSPTRPWVTSMSITTPPVNRVSSQWIPVRWYTLLNRRQQRTCSQSPFVRLILRSTTRCGIRTLSLV